MSFSFSFFPSSSRRGGKKKMQELYFLLNWEARCVMRKEFCSTIAAGPHSWPAGVQPSCGPAAPPSSERPAWLLRCSRRRHLPSAATPETSVHFCRRTHVLMKHMGPVSRPPPWSLSFFSVSFSLPSSCLLNQSCSFHMSFLVCGIHPGYLWI